VGIHAFAHWPPYLWGSCTKNIARSAGNFQFDRPMQDFKDKYYLPRKLKKESKGMQGHVKEAIQHVFKRSLRTIMLLNIYDTMYLANRSET